MVGRHPELVRISGDRMSGLHRMGRWAADGRFRWVERVGSGLGTPVRLRRRWESSHIRKADLPKK